MALEIHLQTLPPRLTRRIKRSHTSLLIFFPIGTAQRQKQGMKRILDHGKSRCGMQSASHFGLCNTEKVSPVWQRRTQTKNTNESTQVSIEHARFQIPHAPLLLHLEHATIGRWYEDALLILDHAALSNQQIVVGSSMGGWMMVLLAQERSCRVGGLVGIGSAPDFTPQ
mmetsp:Transcript_4312/g.6568  ORF Transcript_4312/g.6568 Transcript_4312/m.6568 type:complete len:169 (-) Transcript_4312:590-1096(-)